MAENVGKRASRSSPPPLASLNPLFACKTRVPSLPRPHLPRPRLLGVLRQVHRRRVLVVTAPAGAGKTTLVADFVRAAVEVPSWYSVDELDQNGIALLYGLARAVGSSSARQLNELGYLAQIVAALDDRPRSRVLVVDDVHRLREESAVKALADLLRYLPPAARVILIGRQMPGGLSPILDWLSTQHQLAQLGWEHFQLSEDERTEASRLFKTTGSGGWILGWAHPEGLNLARYLQTEVLGPLGTSLTERLARIAVLPSFDSHLAAAVAGIAVAEATELLQLIRTQTPLLEHLGEDSYRFSETARGVLASVLPSDQLEAAQFAAGQALRPIDPRRSAECFLASGCRSEAARSLAAIPFAEWLTQAPTDAHQILDQLTEDDLSEHDQLRLVRAWASFVWKGETREAARLLASLSPPDDDPPLRFWHLYLTTRVRLALGELTAAIEAYRQLVVILARIRQDGTVPPAVAAGMIARLAMVERFLADSQQATRTAESGLLVTELSPDTARAERQLLHHVLGTFMVWDGNYEAADRHLSAALALADEPGEVAQRAAIRHAQAGVARCRGEFVRALTHLEQALREPLLPPREEMLLTLQAAHALADVQDFRGAVRRYRRVAGALRAGDRDGCFTRALAGVAICCTHLGLTAEAAAALRQLRAVNVNPSRYDLLLAEGVYRLATGDLAAAERHFAEARQVRDTLGGRQDTWQAILLEAQAQLRQGQAERARQTIEDALSEFSGQDVPAVGLWVIRPVQTLVEELSQRRDGAALATLLHLIAATPDSPRLRHAVAAIEETAGDRHHRTEVRLFGAPRLVVDDQEVAWPYGLRHKAIELFWYSALHLDGFTRDQAIADLFPDRDEESGLRLLQVAISSLRRTLAQLLGVPGNRILAREDNGTFRLHLDATPAGIVVETQMLTALSEDLRLHRRAPVPATIPAMFRGELLAGLNADWIDPIRRYWMAVYLRTLRTLADRYTRQGLLQQAIRCHELILQIDPTIESAHKHLMQLYHAAGDQGAVESQMWLYTRLVRDELDAQPTEEIEEIYRQLTASPPQ